MGVSWLREHPYRLLMPLGLMASWIGVGQWLFHITGWLPDYRPVLHALAQTEGFLTCFVAAFLLTMLPRATGTAKPCPALVLSIATLIVAVVGFVAVRLLAISQSLWLLALVTLLGFVISRMRKAVRPLPDSFIWIPASIVLGIIGGVLAAVGGIYDGELWWLHQVGRGLGLQGMLLGLVVGVGRVVFSIMLHGEPNRRRVAVPIHALCWVLLASSFFVEVLVSLAMGYALRGTVVLAMLWVVGGLHRFPSKPGSNRWAIWLAAWMIPAGLFMAAAFSEQWRAGMHVTLIGGLGYLAMSVGAQVHLGHGGHDELKSSRPWWIYAIGFCMALAVVARSLMVFDPARFFVWMGVASAAFITATGVWMLMIGLRSPAK